MLIAFLSRKEAEDEELAIYHLLPPDTYIDGTIATIQITNRWSEIIMTKLGEYAIASHQLRDINILARSVSEEDLVNLEVPKDTPINQEEPITTIR